MIIFNDSENNYLLGKVDGPLSTAYTRTSRRHGSKEYFATVFHNKNFFYVTVIENTVDNVQAKSTMTLNFK